MTDSDKLSDPTVGAHDTFSASTSSISDQQKPRRMFGKLLDRSQSAYQRPSFKEQRDSTRHDKKKIVQVQTGRFGMNKDPNALLKSPSTSGTGLETKLELSEGDDVRLKIDLGVSTKNICNLKGTVVRTRPKLKNRLTEYGIKMDQDYGDYSVWNAFMSKSAPGKGSPASKVRNKRNINISK